MQHMRNTWVAKRQIDAGRAVAEINEAIEWSDWHHAVRREYGVIHTRFNPDRQVALRACQRALADDPYYINNLVNAAGIEIELGKPAAARHHLEQALHINDRLHLAHYALGLVSEAQGDRTAALAEFRKCLELDPNFQQARARITADSKGP